MSANPIKPRFCASFNFFQKLPKMYFIHTFLQFNYYMNSTQWGGVPFPQFASLLDPKRLPCANQACPAHLIHKFF